MNVRFALLVVLMVAATSSMTDAGAYQTSATDPKSALCALAAGVDPERGDNQASFDRLAVYGDAFRACVAQYQSSPPWWAGLAWASLLMIMAGTLFWVLARWKARR